MKHIAIFLLLSIFTFSGYSQISGTQTVGSGGTYTTFKSAGGVIQTINNDAIGLNGNLIIEVISDITETGNNQQLEGTKLNGFTLTIRPSAAISRTITINSNGIHFQNCENVDIDGSFGGSGRFLTFSNPIDNGEAFEIDTKANNFTIQNCIIESNSDQTTEGAIDFATTTDPDGYDNITIHNNLIRDAAGQNTLENGIYLPEPTTAGVIHDNITISDNDFELTGKRAIFLDTRGNTSATITNCSIIRNSFYSASALTLTTRQEFIRIEEADGITISGNYFGGTLSKASGGNLVVNFGTLTRFRPIYFASYINTTSTNTLDSNVFRNIQILGRTDAACDVFLIDLDAGINTVGSTFGNFIGNTTVDATTTPSIEFISRFDGSDMRIIDLAQDQTNQINNNTIGGLSYTTDQSPATTGELRVIFVSGTKTLTIDGNQIGSTTQNSNIYKTTDGHFYGVFASNQGVANLTNNTLAGVVANGNFGNIGNFTAFRSSNTSVKTLTGNTVGNTAIDASSAPNITVQANGGDANFYGIYTGGAGTTVSIANNTIGGIAASAVAVTEDLNLYGIYTTSTQTGDVSLSNNTFGSITQNANIHQSSRGNIRGLYVNSGAANLDMSSNTIGGIKADNEFGDNAFYAIYLNNRSFTGAVTVNNNTIGSTLVDATSNPNIDLFIGFPDVSTPTMGGMLIAPNAATSTTITGNTIAGFRISSAAITETAYLRAIQTNRDPLTTWTISNNLIGSNTQSNSMVQETNQDVYAIYSSGKGDHIFNGNTIRGFKLQNNSNSVFRGIFHTETTNSNVTVSNNTIGDNTVNASTTPSIDINNNAAAGTEYSYGVYVRQGINVSITGNVIGGVRMTSTVGNELSAFRGIFHGNGATTGTVTISNNTIGSSTIANNIYKTSDGDLHLIYQGANTVSGTMTVSSNTIGGLGSGGNFDDDIRGIYIRGTSAGTTIENNILTNCNITNGSSNAGYFSGIHTDAGSNTINNNQITSIAIDGSYAGAVFRGIFSNSPTSGQVISNNTIDNISQTNSSTNNNLRGIHLTNSASSGIMFNNIISGMSQTGSTSRVIFGLYVYNGNWDIYNNVILLGDGLSANLNLYGIYHRNNTTTSTCNYWYNTVEIEGTQTGGRTTYAFWRSNHTNNIQTRNNLFTNNRTGSGSHYAIRNQLASTPWDSDHNAIYSSNSATIGMWGSTANDFATWQANSGASNSVTGSVTVDATGTPSSASDWGVVDGRGTPVSILIDFDGLTRDLVTPDCGAYEQLFSWTAGDLANKTDWFDGDNWSGGVIPTNLNNALIPTNPTGGNFFPDINAAGAECNNLTIETGASVTISGTNSLDVYGLWNNSGTFTANQSTVSFLGAIPQTINSSSAQSFYNITLNNSAGLTTVDADHDLAGTLTLTNGEFNTGGNVFTLISDITGTARIAEITGGSISGDITMQRYIAAGLTDWRFLTSATSNMTLNEFTGDFETSGFPGASSPNFPSAANPWPSIYFYDESVAGVQDNGFTAATNITNTVGVGEGLWVYCGDTITGTQPFLIDMTGPVNTGNINLPISFSNGTHADDGWSMVGNPYPSAIDWDDNVNITKVGMDDAIYIWNPQEGQMDSYSGGVGLFDATATIASSQAFWVQATNGSASLQVTEGAKTTGGTFIKSSTPLTIVATNNTGRDQTKINFQPNASTAFDSSYDAYKIKTTVPGLPTISTIMQDSLELSINQLDQQTIDIPVKLTTTASGIHTIDINGINNFSNASYIIFEDLFTGNIYDLNTVSSVTAFIHDTTQTARFLIKFGYNVATDIEDLLGENTTNKPVVWAHDNKLSVKGEDIENITVRNILGQTLFESNTEKIFNIEHLNTQVLIVSVTQNKQITSSKIQYIKK